MGVKAQSDKKSTCFFSEQQAALVIYPASGYSIFILLRVIIYHFAKFPRKLFLLFISIFTHLTLRKGHAAA